jgi:hypothetical protein
MSGCVIALGEGFGGAPAQRHGIAGHATGQRDLEGDIEIDHLVPVVAQLRPLQEAPVYHQDRKTAPTKP